MFEYGDVLLGHNLQPKALMNGMLQMALRREDIAAYWSIYGREPKWEYEESSQCHGGLNTKCRNCGGLKKEEDWKNCIYL